MTAAEPPPVSTGAAALRALRSTRQRRRLGDFEWFDAAYRAYLVALFGGGGVLWLSSALGNRPAQGSTATRIAEHGPAWLGVIVALAVMLGLRNGAQGGPLALEAADIPMVMLSPVERTIVLRRPATQRLRSAAAMGIAAGAVAGQLAGRRLPGSATAWALSGGVFGGLVGLAWIGAALCAHGFGMRRSLATAGGGLLVAWQAVAAATQLPGPTTSLGSLALWGWRAHPLDLIGALVIVAAVAAGLAVVGRTSLEALARRSSLVSQLRFAVTMQDLRTVVLLRRQLNQESSRSRPWFRMSPSTTGHPVIRRGLQGLARLPATRLVRIAAVAAAVGGSLGAAVLGSEAAIVIAALGAFLIGLEVMEPLSQEIDQPNHTDSYPLQRGALLSSHLVAPLILLVPVAVVVGAIAAAVIGRHVALVPAAVLALPVTLGGVSGGVVSIVRDAPDPFSTQKSQAFMPPEMAGFGNTFRLLLPIVVSLAGVAPVFFARMSYRRTGSAIGGTIRGAAASLLVAAATVAWVRYRDALRARFRQFMDEGRNYNPNRPLNGA